MKPENNPPAPKGSFDYSIWPENFSEFARGVAERIRGRQAAHTLGVIASGRELLDMRYSVPFNLFERWIRDELDMSRRKAEYRMRAAEMFWELEDKVSYLPAELLYRLSGVNAHQATVAAILERIKRGERPSEGEINVLLFSAKANAKLKADEDRRKRNLKRQRVLAPLRKRNKFVEAARRKKHSQWAADIVAQQCQDQLPRLIGWLKDSDFQTVIGLLEESFYRSSR